MKKLAVVVAFATLCLALAWSAAPRPAVAEPAPASLSAFQAAHDFLGARQGCRKCHLKQYRSWEKTAHAKALETLQGDDATNAECLRCHTTGYGEATGFMSAADTPELAGVTCEACHGAGADYIDRELMKDRAGSIAAGLLIPDEQTCLGCHNADSPEFPGSFDYEEMKAKGVHEVSS